MSRLAVGDSATLPSSTPIRVSPRLVQDERTSDRLPFGSRGGTAIRYNFPVDGEYTIKVVLKRQLYDYLIGMGEPHQIDVRLDGALLRRFSVGGEAKGTPAPETFAGNTQGDEQWEKYMHTADAGLEFRVPVKAGTRDVGVSFVRNHWEPEGIAPAAAAGFCPYHQRALSRQSGRGDRLIGGPYQPVIADDTPERRKSLHLPPVAAGLRRSLRTQILSTLARRAYRRPVTAKDVERLLSFYKLGREAGDFDAGIRRGLERILAAPSFLFRVQHEPANAAPGTVYRLNDLDLASRLSFFLWSTIPDDELLDLAVRGKLSDPDDPESAGAADAA